MGYIPYFKIKLAIYSLIPYWIYICFLFLIIGGLIFRIAFSRKKEVNIQNVYTLYDLLNGKVIGDAFTLIDSPIEEDMFNRNDIIKELEDTIINANIDTPYVISLTGEWGSGKTTILNIIKKNIDKGKIYLVDDFDPWQYNDEKTMFEGVLVAITKKLGISLSSSIKAIKSMVSKYISEPVLSISLNMISFDLNEQ